MLDNMGSQPRGISLSPIVVGLILLSTLLAVFWRPYIRISHFDIDFVRFPWHGHKYHFLFDCFTYIVIFPALHTRDGARPDVEVEVINLAGEALGLVTLVQIVAYMVLYFYYEDPVGKGCLRRAYLAAQAHFPGPFTGQTITSHFLKPLFEKLMGWRYINRTTDSETREVV